ncbi:MAG: F0F1 ATP synthase subunit A [Bacteroidota bacterium]
MFKRHVDTLGHCFGMTTFALAFEILFLIQMPQSSHNNMIKPFARILIAILILGNAFIVRAEEENKEGFDAGKMIVEHISDAHDWHLWGEGHHAVSVPLPVIVYNKDRGIAMFLSSHFHHGDMAHNGYKLEEGKVVAVNEMGDLPVDATTVSEELTAVTYDFSMTKNVVAMLFSIALLLWIFLSVAAAYRRNPGQAPKGMQSLVEPLIVFVRDEIAKPSIGPKYMKYMPYLLTVFFFIWINNLLGLVPIIPGGANVTGNIAVTMTLALITFIITTVSANKNYWQHIFAMPGVPVGVLVLLTPIELLGVFLRPFVLMIRLFANITAGHIIALSFFSLIFIFGQMSTGLGLGVSVFSVAFVIFMSLLELLVAFLQAFVFTLLSAIYFGSAVEEHHHDDHH